MIEVGDFYTHPEHGSVEVCSLDEEIISAGWADTTRRTALVVTFTTLEPIEYHPENKRMRVEHTDLLDEFTLAVEE